MAETWCFTEVQITGCWEHFFRYVTELSSLHAVGEPILSIKIPVADLCPSKKYGLIILCRQLKDLKNTFEKLQGKHFKQDRMSLAHLGYYFARKSP